MPLGNPKNGPSTSLQSEVAACARFEEVTQQTGMHTKQTLTPWYCHGGSTVLLRRTPLWSNVCNMATLDTDALDDGFDLSY